MGGRVVCGRVCCLQLVSACVCECARTLPADANGTHARTHARTHAPPHAHPPTHSQVQLHAPGPRLCLLRLCLTAGGHAGGRGPRARPHPPGERPPAPSRCLARVWVGACMLAAGAPVRAPIPQASVRLFVCLFVSVLRVSISQTPPTLDACLRVPVCVRADAHDPPPADPPADLPPPPPYIHTPPCRAIRLIGRRSWSLIQRPSSHRVRARRTPGWRGGRRLGRGAQARRSWCKHVRARPLARALAHPLPSASSHPCPPPPAHHPRPPPPAPPNSVSMDAATRAGGGGGAWAPPPGPPPPPPPRGGGGGAKVPVRPARSWPCAAARHTPPTPAPPARSPARRWPTCWARCARG